MNDVNSELSVCYDDSTINIVVVVIVVVIIIIISVLLLMKTSHSDDESWDSAWCVGE